MAAPNFADKTIWTGDNLDILRGINSECVDLIYLDPPFNSNQDYAAPVGSQAAGAAFKDTWTLSDLDVAWMGLIADQHPAIYQLLTAAGLTHGKGMQAYLCMMAVRLLEMRRVLKPTGSLYLHCDPTANAYLRALLDAVFGQANFRNELVWCYTGPSNTRRWFPRKHDTVLFYVKSNAAMFDRDAVRVPYNQETLARRGRVEGQRSYIAPSVETAGRRDSKQVEASFGRGKVPEDWWPDIAVLTNQRERVGYPTQKPLALLERIIAASSQPGDMVLDPFAGCATACVAAEKLGRQWVGIDLSAKAVELVNIRLREFMGSLFHDRLVTARTDIPRRTDIGKLPPYRQQKHVLFGQQEGQCAGCETEFPFRAFTVDHIVPQSRGGTDHPENLQLLCSHCNSVKGNRPQEYLVARLRELGVR